MNRCYLRLMTPIFMATLLSGCGFQPLLATPQSGTPGARDSAPQKFSLRVNGTGYSAYKFKRELERQLSTIPRQNVKTYGLVVTLTEEFIPTAYGTDATVSRSQAQLGATYTINDSNRTIDHGFVSSHSSYLLDYTQEFSTQSAQAAASERSLIAMAEELAREISLKLRVDTEDLVG